MVLAVLLDHGVVVVYNQGHLFHFIVQHEFEYGLVASELNGSELGVLPLLLAEDTFDETVLIVGTTALGLEVL